MYSDLIVCAADDACTSYVSSAYNFEVAPDKYFVGTNKSYYLNTGYSFTLNIQSPNSAGRQLAIPAAPTRQSAICCPA